MFEKEMISISKKEYDCLIEKKAKLMAIEAVVRTSKYPDEQIAAILGIEDLINSTC